jgi:hypothetical protein
MVTDSFVFDATSAPNIILVKFSSEFKAIFEFKGFLFAI